MNVRVGAVLHRLGLWGPGRMAAGRHRGVTAVIMVMVVAIIGTVVVVIGVYLRRSVVSVVRATTAVARQTVSITSSIATGIMISATNWIVSGGRSGVPILPSDTVTTTVMRGGGGKGRTKRCRTAYSAS